MHQERPFPAQEHLVAEFADAMRQASGRLVVVAGPAGFEIGRAFDEITSQWQKIQPPRGMTFAVSLEETTSAISLLDLVPSPATLREKPGSILYLKNVHNLRPDVLPSVETLVRRLVATKTLCVASVSLPFAPPSRAAFADALDRLRRNDLVRYVTLRPLPRSRFAAEITTALDAVPERLVREHVWRLTRGWPVAITESFRMANDHSMLRVVDRHAFLSPVRRRLRLTETDELVRWLRRAGSPLWEAAKAVAVLEPLDAALPRLLAEAVGVTEPEAGGLLTRLRHAGVLRYRKAESAWRFRMPLVGLALQAVLGPYERRRLARIAVEAIWAGTARPADPGYLPDQLAVAGRLVDAGRSRQELLAHAERAGLAGGARATAWLRAAADLTVDRAARAAVLFAHGHLSLASERADLGVQSLGTLLTGYADEIPADELVPTLFRAVIALHQTKDLDTLEKIAHDGYWPWPGTPLMRQVFRAFAMSFLGYWREAHDLLHVLRQEPAAGVIEEHLGYISPVVNLWLGLPREFNESLAALPALVDRGEEPMGELIYYTGALLLLGELGRADELLERTSRIPTRLFAPARTIRAFGRGEFDASLALARKTIATSPPRGCDPTESVMFQQATLLLLSRGKLTRGRELLAMARSRQPVLPHVLAMPEALLAAMFRDPGQARSVLLTAINQAEHRGVVALTDQLWISLAEIAVTTGLGAEQIPECLQRLDKIADQMETEAAEIHRLSLRAYVDSDRGAAEAALALLRQRAQPYEHAVGIERLVRFGVADPALLGEAYEQFGVMDALMRRAWLRLLMQQHGVPVPGRQATVAENERLLAVLVAEGLTNKEIASVLQTSEKSVESRLSRLFSRTGYQSRVELAAAMLTGQFDTGLASAVPH